MGITCVLQNCLQVAVSDMSNMLRGSLAQQNPAKFIKNRLSYNDGAFQIFASKTGI